MYCVHCQEAVQCKYCDATMTYHRSAAAHARGATSAEGVHTGQLHCHYCLAVNPLPSSCPQCGKKLSLFGLGTQRVEEEITHKFPGLKFARVDSDSMHSAADYEATLEKFSRGDMSEQEPPFANSEVSTRLQGATAELREIEELIKGANVDSVVLREFRSALGHVVR